MDHPTRRITLGALAAAAAAPFVSVPLSALPPTKRMRILILGGTKYLGPALTRVALAQGHHVTLFNRGQTRPTLFPSVTKLRGNRYPERGDGLSALPKGEWEALSR